MIFVRADKESVAHSSKIQTVAFKVRIDYWQNSNEQRLKFVAVNET